jgi:hypothetical protein
MKTNIMLWAAASIGFVVLGCGGADERSPNRDLKQDQAALGSGGGDDDPGGDTTGGGCPEPCSGGGCNVDDPRYKKCTDKMADCLNGCNKWSGDQVAMDICLNGCDDALNICLKGVPGCE